MDPASSAIAFLEDLSSDFSAVFCSGASGDITGGNGEDPLGGTPGLPLLYLSQCCCVFLRVSHGVLCIISFSAEGSSALKRFMLLSNNLLVVIMICILLMIDNIFSHVII